MALQFGHVLSAAVSWSQSFLHKTERFVAGPSAFRTLQLLVAVILFFAAAMKTYALWSAESGASATLGIPTWLVYTIILTEATLGAWLLSGEFVYTAWACSVVSFAIFFAVSLIAAISNKAICGCFGFLSTSPWLTTLMDGSLFFALLAFRPAKSINAVEMGRQGHVRLMILRACSLALAISTSSLLFTAGILAQTNSSHSLSAKHASRSSPPFRLAGGAIDCPSHCAQKTATIIRAALGQDPTLSDQANPIDVMGMLREITHPEYKGKGKIKIHAASDIIATLRAGAVSPILLTSSDEHFYLLLGAIDVNGELMCQVLHGDSGVNLVTKSEILQAGCKEAWTFQSEQPGVPIQISTKGNLVIDRIIQNFGEVNPDQRSQGRFNLANAGTVPITLNKAETSCGCTTTDLLQKRRLLPGETTELNVYVHPKGATSIYETALLTASDEGDGSIRRQELLIVGSQRQWMTIAPKVVEFGAIEAL